MLPIKPTSPLCLLFSDDRNARFRIFSPKKEYPGFAAHHCTLQKVKAFCVCKECIFSELLCKCFKIFAAVIYLPSLIHMMNQHDILGRVQRSWSLKVIVKQTQNIEMILSLKGKVVWLFLLDKSNGSWCLFFGGKTK